MMVDVEILKGTAMGRRVTIPDIQANALASVDFLRIIRKDMEAEDTASEPTTESPPAPAKRRYVRKDMRAEA
jgi:hypothetical protein